MYRSIRVVVRLAALQNNFISTGTSFSYKKKKCEHMYIEKRILERTTGTC
jgi:hypothetical protein